MNREQMIAWFILEGYELGYTEHWWIARFSDDKTYVGTPRNWGTEYATPGEYDEGSPVDCEFIPSEIPDRPLELLWESASTGVLYDPKEHRK